MSIFQYKNSIEREIARINDRIDIKIVKGLSYAKEARRHRKLLYELGSLDRYMPSRNIFSRSF